MMGRRILLGTVLVFMLGWITFAQVKEFVFGFSDQNKWAMESAEMEIIEYKGKEALRIKGADIQISFVRSDGGEVTELIVHQGGQDTPAKKIE